MGQQGYERQVVSRAPDLLGDGWDVRQVIVRTLRSRLPGTARIPASVMTSEDGRMRAALGRFLYRGTDLVHRLDLRIPPASGPEILTVHDLAPWRFPDEGHLPRIVAAEARRAEIVICPSNFAADEVASELGVNRTVVIHGGVDGDRFKAVPMSEQELARFGLSHPFVLHSGGATERKNLVGLAAAWSLLRQARPDTFLAMTGPPNHRRDELFAGQDGVRILGRISHADLVRLMASAAVVVIPSLYEGFGLPALEGMASGVPVVAVSRSALPEVCGDDAIMVEPGGESLAEGLEAALSGGPDISRMTARARERAHRFTWEASVRAHVAVWAR